MQRAGTLFRSLFSSRPFWPCPCGDKMTGRRLRWPSGRYRLPVTMNPGRLSNRTFSTVNLSYGRSPHIRSCSGVRAGSGNSPAARRIRRRTACRRCSQSCRDRGCGSGKKYPRSRTHRLRSSCMGVFICSSSSLLRAIQRSHYLNLIASQGYGCQVSEMMKMCPRVCCFHCSVHSTSADRHSDRLAEPTLHEYGDRQRWRWS